MLFFFLLVGCCSSPCYAPTFRHVFLLISSVAQSSTIEVETSVGGIVCETDREDKPKKHVWRREAGAADNADAKRASALWAVVAATRNRTSSGSGNGVLVLIVIIISSATNRARATNIPSRRRHHRSTSGWLEAAVTVECGVPQKAGTRIPLCSALLN